MIGSLLLVGPMCWIFVGVGITLKGRACACHICVFECFSALYAWIMAPRTVLQGCICGRGNYLVHLYFIHVHRLNAQVLRLAKDHNIHAGPFKKNHVFERGRGPKCAVSKFKKTIKNNNRQCLYFDGPSQINENVGNPALTVMICCAKVKPDATFLSFFWTNEHLLVQFLALPTQWSHWIEWSCCIFFF